MFIEKKKLAAGLLGLAALACTGATAHAQMMRGGRMGGMRSAFTAQVSPMGSSMVMGSMGGFNPGMAVFQPRMFGSNLNMGGGLTGFGFSGSGFNSFGNGLAMPFRAGMGMGGYGMGGYGMGGYGMGGYGGGGGAAMAGSGTGGYGMSNRYGAGALNYSSTSQQGDLPHPAGDVRVAPADAAVIRLRVPQEFATVSFNGQKVSGIGTNRTYVTPNAQTGNSWSYEIKATWKTGNGQKSMERVVEATAGQISTADFTRE
jgi:uncharacterized protein (TIGR03000 family)